MNIKSLFILSFFFSACASLKYSEEANKLLTNAGAAKGEFEKVLKHYSHSRKDSLKLKSAIYLLANIPGHYGVYHHDEKGPDAIFENVRRTLLYGIDSAEWKRTIQSREKKIDPENAYVMYDTDSIKAEFILSNIDNAFYVWRNYPWCKNIDFETFKKYILPYRVSTEPLSDLRKFFMEKYSWLRDSMKLSMDMSKAFFYVYNHFHNEEGTGGWEYGHIESMTQLIKLYDGKCYDECVFDNIIMRALGIVCSLDNIPHWANRNLDHMWNAYIMDESNPLTIDKDKILKKRQYLQSAETELIPPGTLLLPKDISLMPGKKGTKVFRKLFTPNTSDIISLNTSNEEIPTLFNDHYQFDVSPLYLQCYDVKIPVPEGMKNHFAYICIFDQTQLYPVYWGKESEGQILFPSMGSDVLYVIALYEHGKMIPLTDPFILEKDGNIRILDDKPGDKEHVVIKRKYPLFGLILNYANLAYKGKFQGSNKPDFSDAVDLYTIEETNLLIKKININNLDSFRYIRYLPTDSSTSDIAEIKFFTRKSGIEKQLTGKLICKYKGVPARNFKKAFDNDYDSFYKSDSTGTWIGMDLGRDHEEKITKIEYCPRTDTNFIIPGYEYELYYWNNGWKSLGRKIATDFQLDYYNVPENALLYLHCLNGGIEERPFTYENGIQVWW